MPSILLNWNRGEAVGFESHAATLSYKLNKNGNIGLNTHPKIPGYNNGIFFASW
jgi:hypothetical protein